MDKQAEPAAKEIQIPQELGERLLNGDITLSEFLGLSTRTLYAIANLGHQMLKTGNFRGAVDVFRGLVAAAPYDSVFHTHLGAAYANLEQYDEAIEEYSKAINYNIANSDALTGRGELLLRAGRIPEALRDLAEAVKHDKTGRRVSTQRARTMLMLVQRAAQQAKEEKAKASAPKADAKAAPAKAAAPAAKPAAAKAAPPAKAPEKKATGKHAHAHKKNETRAKK